MRTSLGAIDPALRARLDAFAREGFAKRLWAKDASLWKPEPAAQQAIAGRLGWLDSPSHSREQLAAVGAFAREVRDAGTRHVVLLGMGGSSLAAEVVRNVFGSAPGFPELRVLDTTDPAAVAEAGTGLDFAKTLFVVSSKSGITIEVNALYRHFADRIGDGSRFAAITDEGTPLERLARDARFRRCFVNPPDVGGRYAALSLFGMVPAAIIGVDVERLLEGGARMAAECGPAVPAEVNPGLLLGAALGEAAAAGRDKLTLLASPAAAPLGPWIEQLVAESTGKEGRGILPVEGEPIGGPSSYGEDRLFASIGTADRAPEPSIGIEFDDPYALGAEFYRWELATAVAGAVLGVNPFDEPNVRESKDLTNEVIARFHRFRRFPEDPPLYETEGFEIHADAGFSLPTDRALKWTLREHLSRAGAGDYAAWLVYLHPTASVDREVQAMRRAARDRRRLAGTVGYGPRYLHSTGQLHKGGPNRGVFVMLTAPDPLDLPIPGERYTFGNLKLAQALGDFEALRRHGRRVLRIHLPRDIDASLRRLRSQFEAAL
jgi:transaldolase/glucose-6-phosphate isomerase